MNARRSSVSIAIGICALIGLSTRADAAIQLVPVVSTGLFTPTFVGNAGDGSGRLFIEERDGIIRVLQSGSSTPTVFLDIRAKVISGGEQGLLGLAFHPLYPANGRFFVFYTRPQDGALVIAEYRVSKNRDVADTTESVILTIPHPTNANHNGGMLAFGPDGFLYIAVGDGGAADDPPNNAQNVNVLLGKILRIDIDVGVPYVSPSTNPFFGAVPGRDEIFAFGLRNPWRFSFDRLTGQQWVGDVGQSLREEVDSPILNGGNYGWRVFEGFSCTNNDPQLCNPSNYTPPVFEYAHANDRCSITGGYVYRGTAGTLASGTYVYADFCTGEIFAWDGAAQTVLLDTTLRISSFGEDEQGELYVVDLDGSVSRIVSTCSPLLAPVGRVFKPGGGSDLVAVQTGNGCGWTAVANDSWIHVTSGNAGTGNGSVGYSVDPNASALLRTGSITIGGLNFAIHQNGLPCLSTSPVSKMPRIERRGANPTAPSGANCSPPLQSNSPRGVRSITLDRGF